MNDSKNAADDIHSALAQLASATADVSPPSFTPYRVRHLAVLLISAALTLVLFDSEGLVTWAQRQDVGLAQRGWLAALGPLHAALDRVGLTQPRRFLSDASQRISRSLGAGEDPFLSEGWQTPEDVPAAPRVVVIDPIELRATAEPRPLPPLVAGEAATVLLVGDSLIAGSLGTQLSQAMARDGRLRVVSAFQTATGLSRPEVYDWMKVLPQLIERERPRLVVASFGANDSTNIRDGERQLDFGEPVWRRAYAERVTALMRVLAGADVRVLWLGLPPMRDPNFTERVDYLNGIFSQSARRVPRVEFLELGMLVSGGQGGYATFVRSADGRFVRFRLDDGVHYAPAGARAITRWVVDWVYERFRKLPEQPRSR